MHISSKIRLIKFSVTESKSVSLYFMVEVELNSEIQIPLLLWYGVNFVYLFVVCCVFFCVYFVFCF